MGNCQQEYEIYSADFCLLQNKISIYFLQISKPFDHNHRSRKIHKQRTHYPIQMKQHYQHKQASVKGILFLELEPKKCIQILQCSQVMIN